MRRIMGLDVGDRTIGIAFSDLMKITAQGYKTLIRESNKKDIEELKKLVEEKDVDTIVFGLPKNMNGTIGPQGEKVIAFSKKVSNKIDGVKIEFWDERLTTVAATKSLIEGDVSRKKRKKVVDMLAASLILQGYLDRLKNMF